MEDYSLAASSSSPPSLNLLCHEDQSCINDEDDHEPITNFTINCFELEYEVDYFNNLIQKELSFESSSPSSSSDYPPWLIDSRFDVVNWILNTQTQLKYRNQTAYLSVSYLDRFLSIRCIDENKLWAVRLLSVACLCLAAKMEECKVPTLSQYPVSHFGFDYQAIKKMELLILSTFKWKMSLVTPFAYLHYFVKKLGDQTIEPDKLLSKAVELVMALIRETRLTEYRPSVIAAAAVLAASDWQMTQDTLNLKASSVLWETSDNQQQEQKLHSCYSLMQRLSAKGNISTPSSTQVDRHTLDHTPSVVGTKRRLTFNDNDQNPNLPGKNRRESLD